MIARIIKNWLAHPLTKGLAIDDPKTTLIRRLIIKEKGFLRKLYEDWYQQIVKSLPFESNNNLNILEIGSGAGFLVEFIPKLITSEVFPIQGVDRVIDARSLPFPDESLDAIVMTDVFHHIPDVKLFLQEVERCLRIKGRLIMIEPWKNNWSSWVYKNLHHEPFSVDQKEWQFSAFGDSLDSISPLSLANSALPWIVFDRDKSLFEALFPKLKIYSITPQMPFIYLLSGGVSLRGLLPAFSYNFFRTLEHLSLEKRAGMFARIEIIKLQ
jgi:SAM-dependent methyltransferase